MEYKFIGIILLESTIILQAITIIILAKEILKFKSRENTWSCACEALNKRRLELEKIVNGRKK